MDLEILTDLEIILMVVSDQVIPEVSETETLVEDSEMETLVALETEIQMEVLEILNQEDSVILPLNNNQDITMAVSDPVIPEALETMADLIIPAVVSDLEVHRAVAALEAVHPVAVDPDPVVSDNIQYHKKLLKK